MITHPLISVIVPVYNSRTHFCSCINSILNQSFINYEIIIVDDGSTDGTEALCDKYSQCQNILVIHQHNQGVSAARNNGLNHARGQYIAFVDSDDTIKQNFLSELYNAFLITNCQISICGYEKVNSNSTTVNTFLLNKEGLISYDDLWFHSIDSNIIGCFLWNKLFIAEIAKQIRFDTSLIIGEDMVFLADYISRIQFAHYTNKSLYKYRIEIGSAMYFSHEEDYHKIETKLNSSLDAAMCIDRFTTSKPFFLKAVSSYRIERSSLWVLFKMVTTGYKNKELFKRISLLSKKHYSNYKKLSYGGRMQHLLIVSMLFSPTFLYNIGRIMYKFYPKFFNRSI